MLGFQVFVIRLLCNSVNGVSEFFSVLFPPARKRHFPPTFLFRVFEFVEVFVLRFSKHFSGTVVRRVSEFFEFPWPTSQRLRHNGVQLLSSMSYVWKLAWWRWQYSSFDFHEIKCLSLHDSTKDIVFNYKAGACLVLLVQGPLRQWTPHLCWRRPVHNSGPYTRRWRLRKGSPSYRML